MRIAIWNTAFLGDAVLTLPLIQVVHTAFPDSTLDFYVRKGLGSLFAAQPELTAVYEYDKRGKDRGIFSLIPFGRKLAARHYDLWINAHPSCRSALLARLSNAIKRIGYSGGWFPSFCHTLTVSRRFTELDEIERLLELVRPLLPQDFSQMVQKNCAAQDKDGFSFSEECVPSRKADPAPLLAPWPHLVLPKDSLDRAKAFRQKTHAPLLGIHPGSTWATKQWTLDGFARIVRNALDAGAEIALFAGPSEEKLNAEIIHLAGISEYVQNVSANTEMSKFSDCAKVHDFSGKLSLPDLAAFLGNLDCYLCNDSGTMHLAWTQHTPLVAIFGPTTRELGFFPRGNSAIVIEADLPCRPCGKHGHRNCPQGHHNCMELIDSGKVWEAVRDRLFSMQRS